MKQEEKLEEAKRLYQTANADQKYVLEKLFPELQESEDERIRKTLIENFKWFCGDFPETTKWGKDDDLLVKDIISWLEKQGESDETKAKIFLINKGYPIDANGVFPTYEEIYNIIRDGLKHQVEQKSIFDFNANNWCVSKVDGKIHNIYNSGVEPKFHEDEWVVNNATLNLCHILRVEHGQYICDDCSFPITKENEYHLWTIADAKDGDVLATNSNIIFIFKFLDEGGTIAFHTSCTKNNGVYFPKLKERLCDQDVYPATKEQSDTIFAKMKEAGYEFDFEKKELKLCENQDKQKPTLRERYKNIAKSEWFKKTHDGMSISNDEELKWTNDEKIRKKLITYFQDLKGGWFGDISHDDILVWLEKLAPTSKWTEEDEKRLDHICNFVWKNRKGDTDEIFQQEQDVDWLKSLKPRIGG